MQKDQLQEGGGRSLFTLKNFTILAVGFILGYFIKIQAVQTITMGYDDYKLSQWQSNIQDNKEVKAVMDDSENSREDVSDSETSDGNK